MQKSPAEFYADKIAWAKANKRCYKCNKQDAFTLIGKAECAECREHHKKNNRKSYSRNREQINQKRRERYAEDVENGMCTMCHKEKAIDGLKVCAKCRAYQKKQNDKKSIKQGRLNYQFCVENNICTMCRKNNATPDNKVCTECYEILKQNLEHSHQSRANHWWRKDDYFVFHSRQGVYL